MGFHVFLSCQMKIHIWVGNCINILFSHVTLIVDMISVKLSMTMCNRPDDIQ